MAVTIAVMRAAGLTDAQIIDILEVAEKERLAKVREQNRIRQRNQRSRNAVTRDMRDIPPSPSLPPSMVSPITPSLTTPLTSPPSIFCSFDEKPNENNEPKTTLFCTKHTFEQFWTAYPKKVAKKAAYRAFAKALRETSLETILQALARQSPQWIEREYIPYPASWLNAGRWDDQINGEPVLRQQAPQPRPIRSAANGHEKSVERPEVHAKAPERGSA